MADDDARRDRAPERERSRSPERTRFTEPPPAAGEAAPDPAAAAALAEQLAIQNAMAQIAKFQGAAGTPLGPPLPSAAMPPVEMAPPGKVFGTVKTFNMDRGFGFVAPDGAGEDAFAHSAKFLDGNALSVGSRVCFRPSFDQMKQKPIAEELTGAYIDPRRPPTGSSTSLGTLGSASVPPAIPSGMAMPVGATGMPSAMPPSPYAVPAPPALGYAPALAPPPPPPAPTAPTMSAPMATLPGPTLPGALPGEGAPPPGKIMGTVKAFNMDRGFGFVTPDGGGDDLFAHSAKYQDGNALSVGSRVCFKPSFDQQKSKPTAEELTGAYVDPRRPPTGSASGMGIVASTPQVYGVGAAAPSGPVPGEQGAPPGKIMGTVKAFNMEKGFGFIAPDGGGQAQGGDDYFAHAANFLDGNALTMGARVCFRPDYDHQKSKPTAAEVTGAYNDPRRPQPKMSGNGNAMGGGMGPGSFAPPMYGAQPAPPPLNPYAPPNAYNPMGSFGGYEALGYGALPVGAPPQRETLPKPHPHPHPNPSPSPNPTPHPDPHPDPSP